MGGAMFDLTWAENLTAAVAANAADWDVVNSGVDALAGDGKFKEGCYAG